VILLSLVLVLTSLGLLVAGLAGASQVLVWSSIVASVVAGACLAVAALQRRARASEHHELAEPLDAPNAGASASGRAGALREPAAEALGAPVAESAVAPVATATSVVDELGAPTTPAPPAAAGAPGDQPSLEIHRPDEGYQDPPGEPPREEVSAPDALRVADLNADVQVVDGRPRYHLADCPHLTNREAEPLPLAEAREAGFTPCALCRPDATLARQATAGATRPGAPEAPISQPPRGEPPTEGPAATS
jgi:hypothetical protein